MVTLPKRAKYPIEVIIIQGYNQYTAKHDKMRRVIDKNSGHEYYKFKKAKGEYKPVPYEQILPSDKGLLVILYSPSAGQYFLMKIVMDTVEKEVITTKFENNKLIEEKVMMQVPVIKPINESIRQTAPVLHHRMDMIYPKSQTWFEKYGLIIYIIVWGVAIAVPMLFYPTYLEAVGKSAGGVAAKIQEILNQLGVVSQSLSTSVPH